MRKLAHAIASLTVALWVVVAQTEPPGIYVCPMHSVDAHGAPIAPAAPAPSEHAHHHGATRAPDPASRGGHHGSSCMCVGDCGGVQTAIVTPTFALVEVRTPAVRDPRPPTPSRVPVARGDLAIPFAHGPPVRA